MKQSNTHNNNLTLRVATGKKCQVLRLVPLNGIIVELLLFEYRVKRARQTYFVRLPVHHYSRAWRTCTTGGQV